MSGSYPAGSWYADTAAPLAPFPPLDGDTTADVAIVGGGYTGLSAALHLAETGHDVVVLEAERVGWGASGRNGGQLHSGQRRDVDWLEARFGLEEARRLWALAEEAKAALHGLISRHGIACDYRPGLIHAVHKRRSLAEEAAYVVKLRERYRYPHVAWLDRTALAEALGSGAYHGGWRDGGGGHLHPLKFALGLARVAAGAGARIHERSPVAGLAEDGKPALITARGRVAADVVILAGNGYLDGVDSETEARVMPLNNYVLATEPIGAGHPGGILPGGEAASDSRFVVRYWRPTPDGRLVFGGGETFSRRDPKDIKAFVRRHMVGLYPQLSGAAIDYAWGGTLGITRHRLPCIRRVRSGVYAACGYSGHGLALAPFAGQVLAQAIAGNPARFDAFARLPCPPFPGGRWLRSPLLVAAMTWFALRDRL